MAIAFRKTQDIVVSPAQNLFKSPIRHPADPTRTYFRLVKLRIVY